VRLGLDFSRSLDRVRERLGRVAGGGRAGCGGERSVLLHPLHGLADAPEDEREAVAHLRRIEPALAGGLLEGSCEQENLVELIGLDFYQQLVLVGFVVEGEQALFHFHLFDHFIEGLVFAGLGPLGFLGFLGLGRLRSGALVLWLLRCRRLPRK